MHTSTLRRTSAWLALAATAALVLAAAVAGPASATTMVAPDAGWTNFITAPGVDGPSTTGPWTFTSTTLTKLTVTDAFCAGDAFRVVDGVYPDSSVIGETSSVPSPYPSCPFTLYPSDGARADAAMADPGFSHGTFYLAPGSHALEFIHTDHFSPTLAATGGYFRLDTIPLAQTDCKANGWQDFGTLFKNQGQCIKMARAISGAS